MRDNQKLPTPIITPTSKEFDGGHDEPLTPAKSREEAVDVRAVGNAVALRSRPLCPRPGFAAERGLLLVDTKYEFGTDENGTIILADDNPHA